MKLIPLCPPTVWYLPSSDSFKIHAAHVLALSNFTVPLYLQRWRDILASGYMWNRGAGPCF